MRSQKIQGTLKLQIIFIEEKSSIIAYCPALDLSTCGATIGEAETMCKEAAEAFFESCLARGVLDEVLDELGWQKSTQSETGTWLPPHIINATQEIPIAL